MTEAGSRAKEPHINVDADPEEPNTCTVCGARTEFVESCPWGLWEIERCLHCKQTFHFYFD